MKYLLHLGIQTPKLLDEFQYSYVTHNTKHRWFTTDICNLNGRSALFINFDTYGTVSFIGNCNKTNHLTEISQKQKGKVKQFIPKASTELPLKEIECTMEMFTQQIPNQHHLFGAQLLNGKKNGLHRYLLPIPLLK